MSATIDQLHARAKRAIASGKAHFREAADYLAEARMRGASQRQSAKAIGKSPAWVCQLLKWRDRGYSDTQFGPQSKERNARRALRQPKQPPTTEAQIAKFQAERAKAEAQRARAEAVARMFGSPISKSFRAQLVSALAMLPSGHPAERVRARLGMTWEQLIVAAAADSEAEQRAA